MIDIKNNLKIINFLKSVSSVYQETGTEIVIHCPYCDDAMRPNAKSHGHLYISTRSPVFHCFRCEISGHLGSLLKDLGFNNKEILSDLGNSKFSHFSFKEFKTDEKKDMYLFTLNNNIKFKMGERDSYLIFQKYIYSRLGDECDYLKYLISPEIINKQLCCSFYNYDGYFVTARFINPINNIRYYREKYNSELYFFQEMDFDLYKDIVLTEGAFDCLNLHRFSDKFPKDTFYLGILGKNYAKILRILFHIIYMIYY